MVKIFYGGQAWQAERTLVFFMQEWGESREMYQTTSERHTNLSCLGTFPTSFIWFTTDNQPFHLFELSIIILNNDTDLLKQHMEYNG